ncbi:ribosome silencing factor [Desulfurivibrio dismutans]|uniref:ribosome silencing factor n=1 Tax=Desulfurivibrio dismutans TaxID=1398908 RepID=UPI0023DCA69E|nr:ribosome silencing factor [Desulfurivibrio alkaliphilus]MDF1614926.1 ribosome silencing factor [Desulfurivibrio alkaliphilus]
MRIKTVSSELQDRSGLELARIAAAAALDMKAENLVILDVRGLSSVTDYFVLMNGRSTRHVQSLARAVEESLASKRLKSGDTEGLAEGLWVLLDFNDLVVHIFYRDLREFYDLDGLWHDAERIIPEEEAPAKNSAEKTNPGKG